MKQFEYAVFGNRDGSHQLLETTLPTPTSTLDSLRFLVDRPAGHVETEVSWFPYWGCQPVDNWWTIWRGVEDPKAPRKNMVLARVCLVPIHSCSEIQNIDYLLTAVGCNVGELTAPDLTISSEVLDCLVRGDGPAIVPDLESAPILIRKLWTRLWGSARASLTLRTLIGSESLTSVPKSCIVVTPPELKPRWHSYNLIEGHKKPTEPVEQWISGELTHRISRIIDSNVTKLPGDYAVIVRITRIADHLDILETEKGTISDALNVIRTLESFESGLELSSREVNTLHEILSCFDGTNAEEIRAASLTKLNLFQDTSNIEDALTKWVITKLPDQAPSDAIWIIEQAQGGRHADWWMRAISCGLINACKDHTPGFSEAIWQWWKALPDSVQLIAKYLDKTSKTETWLANNAPDNICTPLLDSIASLCKARDWALLLSSSLGHSRSLTECMDQIRTALIKPEKALKHLLSKRKSADVIDALADYSWQPLEDYAIDLTISNPSLLVRVVEWENPFGFVAQHLLNGGKYPPKLVRRDFIERVIDCALGADQVEDCRTILTNLDSRAGEHILDNPCANEVFRINPKLTQSAVEEWWRRFLTGKSATRPPSSLAGHILKLSTTQLEGKPVTFLIKLLHLFPETRESDVTEWLRNTGYLWETGDHERLSSILIDRQWHSATVNFRWSWKQELALVAWYARDLLPWYEQFRNPPKGAHNSLIDRQTLMSDNKIKILFLAANPVSSGRLALDEEAREIEDKIRDSKYRDNISVQTRWAVRPGDLQQALLDCEPTIVHFSGHGGGDAGIVLAGTDQNTESFVNAEALADLFRVLRDNIRVVVLNACYSEVQAKEIVKQIDFVIAMSDSIGDKAARVFASAFYRGLAFGRSIRSAFDLGINDLKLAKLADEDSTPVLLTRDGIDTNIGLVTAP